LKLGLTRNATRTGHKNAHPVETEWALISLRIVKVEVGGLEPAF